jgi:heptosyltransferase-2
MSLPFFDTLRHCFPQSHIDIIAKDTIHEVFQHHPAVQTVHRFSKANVKGMRGLFIYGQTLQKQYGPYDIFFTIADSFSSALIGYGVGCPVRVGYKAEGRSVLLTHRVVPRRGIHRAHIYRHLLRELKRRIEHERNSQRRKLMPGASWIMQTVPPDETVQEITFPFSAVEQQTPYLHKEAGKTYIALNVNSEAQSRRLPLEKWIALGNQLLHETTRSITLVFVGSRKEQPRIAEVIQGLDQSERVLDFSGKTTVRELAMLLRDAAVVLTNDSGPMHLANAVGTPMVTWIGAADPIETEPFNTANTRVINKHLPCSPCVKNICRFPTVRCLEQITVAEIYQQVSALLDMLDNDTEGL